MTEQQTIFVVDDDAALRKGLTLSLRERGFVVESFPSAEAFLDGPDIDRPGCLILDVRMPGMTGLELQDQLRQRESRIPIIFISGHGDIPMTVRAMRSGAIDFLEKPYTLDVLLERIREALAEDVRIRQSDAAVRAIRTRIEGLTPREREVMSHIVAGAANTSNQVVADRLGISRRTVETYRARLMQKMNAKSLTELVHMAEVCGVYREAPSAE